MIDNIKNYEGRLYSDHGEDGILIQIFKELNSVYQFFVEVGASDGCTNSHTKVFRELGWRAVQFDRRPFIGICNEWVTAENINDLFRRQGVPLLFDLLTIDVDGTDYWLWNALNDEYKPSVVVMEYNSHIPPDQSLAIKYKPDFVWDGNKYFGASLLALTRLAARKGYTLVGTESAGVNAFYVKNELIPGHFRLCPYEEMFTPLGKDYGPLKEGQEWVEVE